MQVNTVGTGYFQAIGIPLVKGRDFTRGDTADSQKVVIVNQTMAQQFWKGDDPIGKRFKFFGDNDYTTVVGVAKDSKYNAVAEAPQNYIYQPLSQNYTPAATLHSGPRETRRPWRPPSAPRSCGWIRRCRSSTCARSRSRSASRSCRSRPTS